MKRRINEYHYGKIHYYHFRKEDMALIASSTTGWDTWADTHQPCVRVAKVNTFHWAWYFFFPLPHSSPPPPPSPILMPYYRTENMPYDLQAFETIRAEDAICKSLLPYLFTFFLIFFFFDIYSSYLRIYVFVR